MRFSLATISIVLSCVSQCMATWEEVYGSVSSMSTKGSGGYTTWYQMVSLGEEFTNDMSFMSLLEVANAHWNYVKTQRNAFTKKGTCLVAAVYIPGGRVVLSTIPRGNAKKAEDFLGEMMLGGAQNAPEWWAKKTGNKLDAEDAAVYLTEVNGYIDKTGLKVAVYGTHKGPGDTVGAPVNPCPDCSSMLKKMDLPFYASSEVQDGDADQYESEQLFKRSPVKPAKKKTTASDSSSSAKVASSSSASSLAELSSSAGVSSAESTKGTSESSTKVASSDSVMSTATVSSSNPSIHATSTGRGSAATTSAPTTSITPIKLTAVPFPTSLMNHSGLNMTSSVAATTGRGITSTAISVPTTLQTSIATTATKLK